MVKGSVISPPHTSCHTSPACLICDPFLLWGQCPQLDLLESESSQPETVPHVEAEVVLGQLLGVIYL